MGFSEASFLPETGDVNEKVSFLSCSFGDNYKATKSFWQERKTNESNGTTLDYSLLLFFFFKRKMNKTDLKHYTHWILYIINFVA